MSNGKKICVICGKEFETKNNAITCSLECSIERRRERQRKGVRPRECRYCGKVFTPENYHVMYCSDKCRNDNDMSKRRNSESKKRRSISAEMERIRGKSNGDEIARKAKEAGMSYGMYVAIQHGLPKVEL